MPLDWSPLVHLLRANDDILLMTHIRPDADGLGSQLGLHDALTALGKRCRVVIASKLPPRYRFLDPAGSLIPREIQRDIRLGEHLLEAFGVYPFDLRVGEGWGRVLFRSVRRVRPLHVRGNASFQIAGMHRAV